MKGIFTFVNGIKIINCTRESIKFRCPDNNIVKVKPSEIDLGKESIVKENKTNINELYELIKISVHPTKEGRKIINSIYMQHGIDTVIIGYEREARTYPGEVVNTIGESMIGTSKIAYCNKFTIRGNNE